MIVEKGSARRVACCCVFAAAAEEGKLCSRLHGQLVVAAVRNWRRAEGNRVSTHFSSWPSYLYSMSELLELAVL